MATYTELYSIFNDSTLKNKISVAVVIEAQVIGAEDPATENHAARLEWAKAAFSNPSSAADAMMKVILATYKALEVAEITGASDVNIQSAVSDAVNVFASGA